MNKCKDCKGYFRNTHDLCSIAEMDLVDGDSEACERFVMYHNEDDYCPSATNGDYSPSNPWDAPGMSVKDFI